MTYRVIYSDYIRNSNGSYEVVAGTERSRGLVESFNDAHSTALCWDSDNHFAWVEILVDGVWYDCTDDGKIYNATRPASR